MVFFTSWHIKHRQQFFAPLLPPGAMCFDIGANHGEFAATFLSLGARRVVAVEPQPEIANFIIQAFPKEIESGTLIVKIQAIGSATGVAKLFPANDPGKSMSSLSATFIEVSRAGGRVWNDSAAIEVAVGTLDALIKDFGIPDTSK